MADAQFVTQRETAVVSTNKVLRNTYMLLSMTLLLTAVTASVSMALNVSHGIGFICLLVSFGLIFAVRSQANKAAGIWLVFAFTGLLGFSLGPTLNYYVAAGSGAVVVQAAALTSMIFLSLSGYVLVTRKDFSFMAGFLMTGLWIVIGAWVFSLVAGLMGYHFTGLNLAISSLVVLVMSGLILFDTSRIINGGETNYIMATVSLYLSIYNLFVSLLHLLGFAQE